MNRRRLPFFLSATLLCLSVTVSGQYILNGSAQKVSCNCYTLTDEKTTQSGSVWNSNKISLANSFDFWFTVYLGCRNTNGADGIVFILQPISTSVGTSGEGMGFQGVSPSVGIALDTWQNASQADPAYDHISIQANGVVNHSSDLAGPVQASAASDNIEDCQWHRLRITWDAVTKTLSTYFDGVLRLQKQVDLVGTVFNNNPSVYWGFTAATGSAVNLQQFCTALNPVVSTNTSANSVCEGSPIQFSDASESFAPITNYTWSFGDGTTSTDKNPAPHTYASNGSYQVNLKIKGQDGCENDSTFTVTVGSKPAGRLTVTDTCEGLPPRVSLTGNLTAVSYQWLLDNVPFASEKEPQWPVPAPGAHEMKLIIRSDLSCGQPATVTDRFDIQPAPRIRAEINDGCVNERLTLTGAQVDNATTISRWYWNVGEGPDLTGQTVSHAYAKAGVYTTRLRAEASNGCLSPTEEAPIVINEALVFAGRDSAVIKGRPFQLQGSGNGSFLWSPPAGLSNAGIADPLVVLENDRQFVLTVSTAEGCVASDTVLIKTFLGPAIYVPTAFTPNGDGKNETLRPVYVGIKELKQFAVFNRWGQKVFGTGEIGRGWDGKNSLPGTYVWVIEAVEGSGKKVVQKGTVTVIR